MKSKLNEKATAIALVMGVATLLFCLVIADGLLGIRGLRIDNGDGTGTIYMRNKTGAIIFWAFLLGLPVLVSKWVRWIHTVANLLLYFVLYFPVYYAFGNSDAHAFLGSVGFAAMPVWFCALYTAVVFWGIQSIMFCLCSLARYLTKKSLT